MGHWDRSTVSILSGTRVRATKRVCGIWIIPPLPDVGQKILVEAGVYEDLLDLQATDEAVHVGVRLQEDVVVAAALGHGHHPVNRMLGGERRGGEETGVGA